METNLFPVSTFSPPPLHSVTTAIKLKRVNNEKCAPFVSFLGPANEFRPELPLSVSLCLFLSLSAGRRLARVMKASIELNRLIGLNRQIRPQPPHGFADVNIFNKVLVLDCRICRIIFRAEAAKVLTVEAWRCKLMRKPSGCFFYLLRFFHLLRFLNAVSHLALQYQFYNSEYISESEFQSIVIDSSAGLNWISSSGSNRSLTFQIV